MNINQILSTFLSENNKKKIYNDVSNLFSLNEYNNIISETQECIINGVIGNNNDNNNPYIETEKQIISELNKLTISNIRWVASIIKIIKKHTEEICKKNMSNICQANILTKSRQPTIEQNNIQRLFLDSKYSESDFKFNVKFNLNNISSMSIQCGTIHHCIYTLNKDCIIQIVQKSNNDCCNITIPIGAYSVFELLSTINELICDSKEKFSFMKTLLIQYDTRLNRTIFSCDTDIDIYFITDSKNNIEICSEIQKILGFNQNIYSGNCYYISENPPILDYNKYIFMKLFVNNIPIVMYNSPSGFDYFMSFITTDIPDQELHCGEIIINKLIPDIYIFKKNVNIKSISLQFFSQPSDEYKIDNNQISFNFTLQLQ